VRACAQYFPANRIGSNKCTARGVVCGDGEAPVERPEADASVARERGSVCAILVADCLPVLFTDRSAASLPPHMQVGAALPAASSKTR
jgi:hypothetical protein